MWSFPAPASLPLTSCPSSLKSCEASAPEGSAQRCCCSPSQWPPLRADWQVLHGWSGHGGLNLHPAVCLSKDSSLQTEGRRLQRSRSGSLLLPLATGPHHSFSLDMDVAAMCILDLSVVAEKCLAHYHINNLQY